MNAIPLTAHVFQTLRARPLHTFLLILCVAVGVIAVGFVEALTAGVERQLQSLISDWRQQRVIAAFGHLSTNDDGVRCEKNSLLDDDPDALQRELGTRATFYPRLSMPARVASGGFRRQMDVNAVGTPFFRLSAWYTADGSPLTEEDEAQTARVCVIGSALAHELFELPQSAVGKTVYVNDIPFRVKGVLETRGRNIIGEEQDERIFLPVSTARKRAFCVQGLRGIGFAVANPLDDESVTVRITEILRDRHHLAAGVDDDFRIVDPKWLRARYAGAFETKLELGLALTIIAAAIAIGVIANAMMVAVQQRRGEIGLKRALGATKTAIAAEVLYESAGIAIAGGAVGLSLFAAAARIVPRMSEVSGNFSTFPLAFTWHSVVVAFLFAIGIGTLAGAIPARRASRVTPIEALRS